MRNLICSIGDFLSKQKVGSVGLHVLLAMVLLTITVNVHAQEGLMAHWNFDSCLTEDVSGNGHDGIVTGLPECVPGVTNEGLELGWDKWIEVDDPNGDFDFNGVSTFTIEMDFKPNVSDVNLCNENGSYCTSVEFLIARSNLDTEWNYGVFYNRATGQLYAGYHVSPEKPISAVGSVVQGEWSNFVMTYNAGLWNLYLNDVLVGSMNDDNLITDAGSVLAIGRKGISDRWADFFDGSIDNVMIYDYAIDDPSQVPVEDAGTDLVYLTVEKEGTYTVDFTSGEGNVARVYANDSKVGAFIEGTMVAGYLYAGDTIRITVNDTEAESVDQLDWQSWNLSYLNDTVTLYVEDPPMGACTSEELAEANQQGYDAGYVDGLADAVCEQVLTQADIDAAFDAGLASVPTCEQDFTQMDIDNAFSAGLDSATCEQVLTQVDIDAAFADGLASAVCEPEIIEVPVEVEVEGECEFTEDDMNNAYQNAFQNGADSVTCEDVPEDDGNNGHGNDQDCSDESNPGNSNGCNKPDKGNKK